MNDFIEKIKKIDPKSDLGIACKDMIMFLDACDTDIEGIKQAVYVLYDLTKFSNTIKLGE